MILSKWRYQIGMKLVVYNEWQKEGSPLGSSFAAADASLHRRLRRRHTVPRLGYAYAATFRQCSSKLGTALNFRSSHHGRGALQLPDEDLPPRGRRTLRRHRAQCQTALRRLQETERDVISAQTQVVEVERPPQLPKLKNKI